MYIPYVQIILHGIKNIKMIIELHFRLKEEAVCI